MRDTARQETIKKIVYAKCLGVSLLFKSVGDVLRVVCTSTDGKTLDTKSFSMDNALGRISIEADKWAKHISTLLPPTLPPQMKNIHKPVKHRVFKIYVGPMECVGGIPPNHDQLF